MIRRDWRLGQVRRWHSTDFVWFINGRHDCGPRVRTPKGKLQRVRWAKRGGRFGRHIGPRMKLWRITGEAPF